MVKNGHGVSKRQWKKWSELARAVFNDTYETALVQTNINAHPKSIALALEPWQTTAWNIAFVAACAVTRHEGHA